jgi:hypothetical protein
MSDLVVRIPDYTAKGSGFDSRRYQIFREVVSLEGGQLSLVRVTLELFRRIGSGFGLANRD